MSVEEDVAEYDLAAREHGAATDVGNEVAANKAADRIHAAWRRMRNGVDAWQPSFATLLEVQNGWVRLWAASHFVHVDAGRSVTVLEALVASPGFLGFSAEMTLKAFREGTLLEP